MDLLSKESIEEVRDPGSDFFSLIFLARSSQDLRDPGQPFPPEQVPGHSQGQDGDHQIVYKSLNSTTRLPVSI